MATRGNVIYLSGNKTAISSRLYEQYRRAWIDFQENPTPENQAKAKTLALQWREAFNVGLKDGGTHA